MSKDSGGLSREEFLIVQEQLIELRNKNYELKDELKRKQAEILSVSAAQSPKSEALQFASKFINRGKDKDKEALQIRHDAEIDALQLKLATQEQEFRLQQETLLTEINRVVSENTCLRKDLETYKTGAPSAVLKDECSDPLTPRSHSTPAETKTDELRQNINTLTSENKILEERNEKIAAEFDEVKARFVEYSQKLERAEKEVSEKDVLLHGLENRLLDSTDKIEKTNSLLNQAQSTEDSLKAELRSCQEKLATLESDNQLLRCQRDEDAQQSSAKEESITELQLKVSDLEESVKEGKSREQELLDQNLSLERELEDFKSSAGEFEQVKASLNSEIFSKNKKIEELQKALADQKSEAEKTLSAQTEKNSSLLEELSSMKQAHQDELMKEKGSHEKELEMLHARIADLESQASKNLEDRVLLLETRYQLELADHEKRFEAEKGELTRKISSLEEALAAKDEEKNLALKKQSAVLKELQRAVREERKRADSVEKSRGEREGWHVVDSDVRSNHTFDGNESVSSVSALESDNAELISRLSSMHRTQADTTERLIVLESENARLLREVDEKNELIEHWIRTRPTASQGIGTQKQEGGVFRKFLSSSLPVNESANDIKEMNRKLQRMLEETLSKNILLQRDLQTLLERTEM